ncbi:DUF1707 domain-containing protein [Streptomyces sp. NPDC091406]|uniref:DUF1707 SHOCT-like domain-containing protein n=1 Tax=unclassified Streptomyces TaxID=2593676 RepID=UPI0038300FE3
MSSVPENPSRRISEGERDAAVERLQDAFTEGHVDAEEMNGRLQVALTATTQGELASAVASLPDEDSGPVVTVNSVGGLVRRRGRWQVPRRFGVVSTVGKVYLDLSRAAIRFPEVTIDLRLQYGWAWVIVPSAATVDLTELRSDWKQPVYKAPRHGRSGGPRIHISGAMEYGRLRVRHGRN